MFAGNKKAIKSLVFTVVEVSLKSSFSQMANWNHDSYSRANSEFLELALLVTEKLLSNMVDTGDDLPFAVAGNPTKTDVAAAIALVKEYYDKRFPQGKYATKKADAFKKDFEHRFGNMVKSWKQKEKEAFLRR